MTRVERLELEIDQLTPEEFASLREWLVAHDAKLWDHQFENDARDGRLDDLASEALNEYDRDETTEL